MDKLLFHHNIHVFNDPVYLSVAPEIMWFEKMYVWLRFFERNVLYPAVILCALTQSSAHIICKFGS